jgi:hypothetical protein
MQQVERQIQKNEPKRPDVAKGEFNGYKSEPQGLGETRMALAGIKVNEKTVLMVYDSGSATAKEAQFVIVHSKKNEFGPPKWSDGVTMVQTNHSKTAAVWCFQLSGMTLDEYLYLVVEAGVVLVPMEGISSQGKNEISRRVLSDLLMAANDKFPKIDA